MNTERREFLSALAQGAAAVGAASLAVKGSEPVANARSRGTGYVTDDRYVEHLMQKNHPESPARLRAIAKKMTDTGLISHLVPVALAENPGPSIALNHSKEHVAGIDRLKLSGEIARLAVAGALGAVDAVCEGRVRNAFCALRPPGHHALNTGREEGFCYYNNVAIAARHAQKNHGIGKVLIIDWDYHHGNGTEWAFYSDPTVLFFSTHDRWAYPGTGDPRRKGDGEGVGCNLNVHCGCRTSDKDMLKIWESTLLPKAAEYKPELILISAGFDSRKDDLLGCFRLTDVCFALMTRMAMQMAEDTCHGRLVSLLEGGYNIQGLAEATAAHVQTLIDGG